MNKAKYLWLDLETTGLDPEENAILEAYWVITDEQFNELHERGMVCNLNWAKSCGIYGDALEIHASNGLLAECAESQLSLHDLGNLLVTDIDNYEEVDTKLILAGSSVHFDRGFIKKWLSEVDELLHYRHFDVSVLKMAIPTLNEIGHHSEHRAQSDIYQSLTIARTANGFLNQADNDLKYERSAMAALAELKHRRERWAGMAARYEQELKELRAYKTQKELDEKKELN